MKKNLTQMVTNSIFDVMETMFYFTLEEKKDMGNELSAIFDIESLRSCKITFSGDHAGTIYLMVPQTLLTPMTQNFMGEDNDDLSEELTDGTLKEALNMIAGNALTLINKESYMGLGIPEMIDAKAIPFNADGLVFNTGQGYLATLVEMNESP